MSGSQKTVIVGAGPVGSLAALYAAQRGHDVELYELRPDLRSPETVPLNFTKSINLAVSERGIHAMSRAGHPDLLETVMNGTIPMRGRMIHSRDSAGNPSELAQDYDAKGRTIYAIDRSGLNKRLLDVLDSMSNVKVYFNHKLTGADFRSRRAWFETCDTEVTSTSRPREIEISFDLMIGADGAHSAVRYHMMKFTRMDYQQEYIDTLWCEFSIEPREQSTPGDQHLKFRISPNHLHIWPGKDFMFIAIPSNDGSFTCTLFLPSKQFIELERDPERVPTFFDQNFPGVTDLISSDSLISSFQRNPHLPLISLKCRPHHYSSSGVIIGDAAHAMVPFYGQGMNAGLEDVRILFSLLDRQNELQKDNNTCEDHDAAPIVAHARARALAEYSTARVPDSHAINELALQNYVEMRSSVLSRRYKLRKMLEEYLSIHFPSLGWQTQYSRVSFSNESYKDVIANSKAQGTILTRALIVCATSPVALAMLLASYRYRQSLFSVMSVIWKAR